MDLEGLRLWPHHVSTIERTVERVAADPAARALVLGGSLAHGYGTERSDVDVLVLVPSEELERRPPTFTWHDLSEREDCYVDGKYLDLDFLRAVAERGSDPSRWALEGARVLFSHEPGLAELLAEAARFPIAEQERRLAAHAAQLCAWQWFYGEGTAKAEPYLQHAAVHHLVLHAGRLVLAANARLYPFHKWLMREVEAAPDRPEGLTERLRALLAAPSQADVDSLVSELLAHYGLDEEATRAGWGSRFRVDTELVWLHGREL